MVNKMKYFLNKSKNLFSWQGVGNILLYKDITL